MERRLEDKFSTKSNVSNETIGLDIRVEHSTTDKISGDNSDFDSRTPCHFACMYFNFLHGAMCIFLSFMHFFDAEHSILINDSSLSVFPIYISGSRFIIRLYSWLALTISNSARKFSSIITRITPFLEFEVSNTSTYVCSPIKQEKRFL